jgi:hypothetical protein
MFDNLPDRTCVLCARDKAERELAELKKQQFSEITKVVKGELCPGPRKLDHLAECMAELIDRFGGIEGFVGRWHEHIEILMAQNPGSRVFLDHMRSIAKIWLEVNKLQRQERIEDMNDQQLASMREVAVREMLTNIGTREMISKLIEATDVSMGDRGNNGLAPDPCSQEMELL